MTLRSGHGGSGKHLVVVETRPVDELGALNADDTVQGLAITSRRGRPFQRGNRAAAGRPPALASSAGMPLDAADPLYKKCLAWARRYRKHRIKELAIQHGGDVSSGVCSLITSASLDMAASRYVTARVAAGGNPADLKLASQLGQAAKQSELCALEIAAREAAARPQMPTDYLAQWRRPEDEK